MGIRKQTHYNTVITPELVEQIETMRKAGMQYNQIADTLGLNRSTIRNAISEQNLGERTKVYRAAHCDKWDFSGKENNVCARN